MGKNKIDISEFPGLFIRIYLFFVPNTTRKKQ